VPNFTWDMGPTALEIPKGPLLLFVGGVAILMLLYGLIRKQNDLTVFGLFMGALIGVVSSFLPDPIAIRFYSLLFVGVFLGGYSLLNWQIRRGKGDAEVAGDFIVYGVVGVLAGARLGHVIFYDFQKELDDPLWVFRIWEGGLASHGAVIGLIIAMWIFTKRRGVPFLEGADRFAFSAALGATLVRVGNFFNSEIVGRKVPDQSWGVRFPRFDVGLAEAPLRYPTQAFEALLGMFVLLCLYLVDRAAGREKRPRGLLISVFFLVYFIGRFIVEFWKEHQVFDTTAALDMGQFLSIPGMFLGAFGVYWSLKNRIPVGWAPADPSSEDEKAPLFDPDVDEAFGEDDEDDEDDAPPAGEDKPKSAKQTQDEIPTAKPGDVKS
jgi:phosphatidylglycerol---prolipoprotein diacylglyceryl transferase